MLIRWRYWILLFYCSGHGHGHSPTHTQVRRLIDAHHTALRRAVDASIDELLARVGAYERGQLNYNAQCIAASDKVPCFFMLPIHACLMRRFPHFQASFQS
jgi:hypothetical protein